MFTAYVVVTLMAIAANAFSGVADLVHLEVDPLTGWPGQACRNRG